MKELEKFETEKDAQIRCDEINKIIPDTKMCPIIINDCHWKHCICWVEAAPIRTSNEKVWYAGQAYCNNLLITGSITIENMPY